MPQRDTVVTFSNDVRGYGTSLGGDYGRVPELTGDPPKGWYNRSKAFCCSTWYSKTAWAVGLLTSWALLMVLPPLAPSEGRLMMLAGDRYPYAKCLDGSQAGFYVREGDPVRFVIALQGATLNSKAPCVEKDSCKQLSQHTMGSSSSWKSRIEFKKFPEANAWANDSNPTFREYTQVFVPYCSGDMWSGTKQKADWGVHFRGHNILDAVIQELKLAYGIHESVTVIFAGGGDGGVGVMLNLDFVAVNLMNVNVVGVPIAGWEISSNNTYPASSTPPRQNYFPLDDDSLKQYYETWGSYVPTGCRSLNQDSPWSCLVADHSFESMSYNVFVVNAQTDSGAMTHYDGMPHAAAYENATDAQKSYMTEWSQRLNTSLEKVSEKPGQGLFSPACYMHQGFGYTQPTINNMTYIQAFERWLNREKVKLRDDCGTVCNPSCPESTV